MSPASVSNFVGDLVAMATAFERLPQVEADLADARNTINAHLNTIQRLEHKLLDRANDLTDAQSRIRSLEVERDDAQFHALEADDRTQRALDFIKATFGNAGSLIQALEPPASPKPEPATSDVPVSAMPAAPKEASVTDVPKAIDNPLYDDPQTMPINSPEPVVSVPSGEPNGASSASDGGTNAPTPIGSAPELFPAPEVAASPGEPASDAITPTAETPKASVTDTVSQEASATGSASPDASRRFVGKTWSEARSEGLHPPLDKEAWLDGGGTLDNYYA